MAKNRGKIGKYSKISLQKKYQLLKLSRVGKMNLKETSQHLMINYSTAKTIFFQYQNKKNIRKLKFFQNEVEKIEEKQRDKLRVQTASYKQNSFTQNIKKHIKIICTSNHQKIKSKDQVSADRSIQATQNNRVHRKIDMNQVEKSQKVMPEKQDVDYELGFQVGNSSSNKTNGQNQQKFQSSFTVYESMQKTQERKFQLECPYGYTNQFYYFLPMIQTCNFTMNQPIYYN